MNFRRLFNRAAPQEEGGDGELTVSFLKDRTEWRRNGELHRGDDMPARVWENGLKEWFVNGKRHRDKGPAIVRPCGCKVWYKNGDVQKTVSSETGEVREYYGPKRRFI